MSLFEDPQSVRHIADLWPSLQNDFDVQAAKRHIGKTLDKIAPATHRQYDEIDGRS